MSFQHVRVKIEVQTGVQLARFRRSISGLNGAESTARLKINCRMLYGRGYGLLELLANFWQSGFLITSPQEGESENRRVYIGDSNGGPGWT